MTNDPKSAFLKRPGDPDRWVRATDRTPPSNTEVYAARLTIDVTIAMRGRLKIVAFRRGQTVADMLRTLLDREYPDEGGAS